ncbi:MAG: BamA/TamA family outer membrane protein [Bacteroidota bacterium]
MRMLLLSLLAFFFFFISAQAQQDSVKRSVLSAYPLVYYLPETGLGFGGGGVYTFRLTGESNESRPSQVQTALSYTLKNQILLYLYGEFYKNDQKIWVRPELGFYRYTYDFFGVGNELPLDYIESFNVTFPRIRVNAQYLVLPDFYSGVRYWFDDYNITKTEEGSILNRGLATGSEGGIISGLGWVNTFDNRDNVFFPTKGYFVEAVAFWNQEAFGSDFNFNRYTIDAVTYLSSARRPRQVLALNLYAGLSAGEVPFNELQFLGGSRQARGYYLGRFRDKNMLLAQAEYRFPLFWRLGMTVFGSYGGVAPSFSAMKIQNYRWNAGAGLRFLINKKEGVNVRADLGFGEGATNFYLTIGEAF